MAKYLVGEDVNTWRFADAVNEAKDGDTIVFQEGCSPTVNSITINKNLTLVGHASQDADGMRHFSNVVNGQLFINNGATVVLENLWFRWSAENSNVMNCKGKSTVQMTNVVLENAQTEGGVYPVIYAENECNLKLKDVTLRENKKFGLKFYCKNCVVVAETCAFQDCSVVVDQTELTMRNSSVFATCTNAIQAENTTIILESVTVDGCDKEKNYPAIWSKNSEIMMNNCAVNQSNYAAAVYMIGNSCLRSENDTLESVKVEDSRVICSNTVIRELFQALSQSYACIKNGMNILGVNDEKIDLLVSGESVLVADKISVNRVCNPNFRIELSSVASIKEVEYIQGDVSALNFVTDETSTFSYQTRRKGGAVDSENGGQLSAREQLNQMIGLGSVKKEIDKMLRMVEFNQQRIAKGLEPQEQSFHSVFLGNPGTGKTTVARLIGEVLFESGAFKSDEFKLIEASEPDFISQNVGGTAQQTLALLEKAKGGVLFIDEAYALNKKDSNVDFGIEAINTILKYMEDHRGEIMVIFAGYTKEMEQFLKKNPGLTSRVPNKFVFEDYTPDEIIQIGETDLLRKQYRFENKEYYDQQVKRAYRSSLDHSNARWIRNFNEKLLKALANRVMNEGEEDLETIRKADIDEVLAQGKYQSTEKAGESALDRLQSLIGIANVKEQVNRFISLAELNQRREEQGQINTDFTLHSLFLGNPGTGKTTVARIIGEVLYQKGIISQKKFIEVSRSDLVAGYIGQTALKTHEVLESALGGVLFIDEAYSLNQDSQNDFGIEAIDEILKFMEDHRKDMVIIFAGYTREMMEFLKTNSGLASRVPHTFDFEDYTPDEIVQIGMLGLHNAGYEVDESYYGEVVKNNYAKSDDHSNGRWVRNLNEQLIMVMSDRVAKSADADLNAILNEDLDAIAIRAQGMGGRTVQQPEEPAGSNERMLDDDGFVVPSGVR